MLDSLLARSFPEPGRRREALALQEAVAAAGLDVENLPEERRLAYVALTRARDGLLLHHADRLDTGDGEGVRGVAVSPFLAEIRSGQPVTEEDRRPGADVPADAGAADWLAAMRQGLDGS